MPGKMGSNEPYLAISGHLEEQAGPSYVYLIKHSMDNRSRVNLTPKVKVNGSEVKFSTRSYGDEIWHGWSFRHSKYVKNIFKVIQGH